MMYSHWMSPGPGQGLGPEPGRMGCMVLRTFHTAPEQEQGPEQGQERMLYVPIFQVLKLFQLVCFNDISMAFRCPVLAPDTASVSGFCIISVPVQDTASVNTPLKDLFILVTVFRRSLTPSFQLTIWYISRICNFRFQKKKGNLPS